MSKAQELADALRASASIRKISGWHGGVTEDMGKSADELLRLEAANKELLEALKRADGFITNGIELGFIRMPDKYTPDPAHETPAIVKAAIQKHGGRTAT